MNKLTTTVAAAMLTENANVKSQQQLDTNRAQSFLVIWLDANIDEKNNKDSIDTISKLREVINNVHTFINADECINFISNIDEGQMFLISSGAFGQTIVPKVHDMPQISAIYIFCGDKSRHMQWTKQWSKIKLIDTNIKPICEALKQAVQEGDQNSIPISLVDTSADTTIKNLDQLDPSFMYTQILKEILLTIDFEQRHIQEFTTFCREQFADNPTELKRIDQFEHEYRDRTPMWWYTSPFFLYLMLNRALRTLDVTVIMKMGFFLCDLHRQITRLHAEQYGGHIHSSTFTVYRGQGLSQIDFDHLVEGKGGLLSFNNFLSTQKNREISLMFTESAMTNPNYVGVLFVMTIDPSISSTPFANISTISYFQEEEEIIFSMHSVFRIREIKPINKDNRLWQVDLSLTSDTDPQLQTLTECLRNETFPTESGWYRLGALLITMGQFDNAYQIYEMLLKQTHDDWEKANIYHQLGRVQDYKGEYAESIRFNEKALEIKQKTLPPDDYNLAVTYNNIGLVYEKMSEYSKALSFGEKALEIKQKILPPNHPALANSYNNIGLVYEKMGEYSKALSFQEKALAIKQKCFPPNHPELAITYNNLSRVYTNMADYSRALLFCERALHIGQSSLPPNHPDLQKYQKDIESLRKKI